MTLAEDNQKMRDGALRAVPLNQLLEELRRRAYNRPFTGVPRQTAQALVAMFEKGEEANAVDVVARVAQVSYAYETRESIEGYLGPDVRFTDEQWNRLFDHLDDLDGVLNEGMSRDLVGEWIHKGLREAGIDPEVDL